MRHDLVTRKTVRQKLSILAQTMIQHEVTPQIDENEELRIADSIQSFQHADTLRELIIGGVDGSGDFPSLTYNDVFIYITLAQGTRYRSHPVTGLKEVAPELEPLLEFSWLPQEEILANNALIETFSALCERSVREVIEQSDYQHLKAHYSRYSSLVSELEAGLIKPHAADTGNLAIQFRSTGELAAALQLINSDPKPNYVLIDSTFSLPFVHRSGNSLFFEHLKRLCCVEATQKGIGFFALSKSHGLPNVEQLEKIAAIKQGQKENTKVEHWYLRIPTKKNDGWELQLLENRQVPPVGSVSYLVRFHRNTPVMRLDMDIRYWEEYVKGDSEEETRCNEHRIFEDLDYASHDQRAYGYPYPIKAGHDRASLTKSERTALRKMIIDEAIQAGMRPQLFRNVSQATGHA